MKRKFMIRALFMSLLLLATVGLTTSVKQATVFADTVDATIDDSSTRSITIHKYAGTAAQATGKNESATGTTTDAPASTSTPVANVQFTIQKVVPKTGETSDSIVASNPDTYQMSGDPFKGSTNADGTYKQNLGTGTDVDGLYLVTELASLSIATPTPAFIVSVPQVNADATSGTNNSVNYDVNVYPKNEVVSTTLNPTIAFHSTLDNPLGTTDNPDTQMTSTMSQGHVIYKYTIDTPTDITSILQC